MGTNGKLVPGELLKAGPELRSRDHQIFKINNQTEKMCLNKKINEEIAHV